MMNSARLQAAVSSARPAGTRVIEAYSLKLGRRLQCFEGAAFEQWIRLEVDRLLAQRVVAKYSVSMRILWSSVQFSSSIVGEPAATQQEVKDCNHSAEADLFRKFLIGLGRSTGVTSYFAAWTLLGVAMSLTLYEAAFATINRKFALGSRQAISTLTLFAGFASTVFWPLTLKLSVMLGWRDTYFWLGIVQLLVCLPLHVMLGKDAPRVLSPQSIPEHSHTLREALRHPAFWKLAMAFAANMFIFSALSVHLIPLLKDFGHTAGLAVLMATLICPMQVAGRICERTFARNALLQKVGMFSFAALPAAILTLLLWGHESWAAAVFCVLYGLSNGILTIVRGTIPQAMFGRRNYGAISGAMAGPSLLAKAAGPLLAAAVLRAYPAPPVLIAILLGLAFVSLAFYASAVNVPSRSDEIPGV
jgi:predicted MFS family arabinose efflux permease